MGAVAPALDGVMAAALAEHRDRFNAVVVDARRARSDFDVGALTAALAGPLRETVEACEAAAPGSGGRVLAGIFGPVVELLGRRPGEAGPGVSRDPLIAALPGLAPVLIDEPGAVIAALANAAVHLVRFACPLESWLERVIAAARCGAGAAAVLRVGQVAAWAAGLAHYRDSALLVAATLDGGLLGAALSAPGPLDVTATVTALTADRWWRPGRELPSGPEVAQRVGGFSGFGGPFLALPRLGARHGALAVSSDPGTWLVHADAYGATLTRASPGPLDEAPAPRRRALPHGLRPSAAVATSGLTAAVVPTSYQVLIVEPGR